MAQIDQEMEEELKEPELKFEFGSGKQTGFAEFQRLNKGDQGAFGQQPQDQFQESLKYRQAWQETKKFFASQGIEQEMQKQINWRMGEDLHNDQDKDTLNRRIVKLREVITLSGQGFAEVPGAIDQLITSCKNNRMDTNVTNMLGTFLKGLLIKSKGFLMGDIFEMYARDKSRKGQQPDYRILEYEVELAEAITWIFNNVYINIDTSKQASAGFFFINGLNKKGQAQFTRFSATQIKRHYKNDAAKTTRVKSIYIIEGMLLHNKQVGQFKKTKRHIVKYRELFTKKAWSNHKIQEVPDLIKRRFRVHDDAKKIEIATQKHSDRVNFYQASKDYNAGRFRREMKPYTLNTTISEKERKPAKRTATAEDYLKK